MRHSKCLDEIAGMSTTDIVPDSKRGELGGLGSTSLLSELDMTDLVRVMSSRTVEMAMVCVLKSLRKQQQVRRF